ncbi:MAG: 3-hydroxy-3-methylglutaryl-CoA reductase, partial [Proteobacteria bacterium]|nr:3-hydroxy-3-methylglutaryl-CoA reductase [Pseudomonadota bacterium]
DGYQVARRIEQASLFAHYDVFRATTHNKGIMNGISSVALATGNDLRAVEAAAHSYAAYPSSYKPLSRWHVDNESRSAYLVGRLKLPIPVGVVGGMTRFHPVARVCLKMLAQPSGPQLAEIMAAVGLAQNLAALKALSGDGIQKGHMRLHHKKIH